MFASKAGAYLSEAPLLSCDCKDFYGTCPLDGCKFGVQLLAFP